MSAALPADLVAEWTSQAHTKRGEPICIRPLRPGDRVREIAFIDSLSERTRYLRVLTPLKYLPPHLLDQFMDVDYDRRMAFAATIAQHGVEEFVGIARYGATDRRDTAEIGVTVTDAWQRRGIARALLNELIRYARHRGFRRLTGVVLPENHAMLAFARRAGFEIRYDPAEHLMCINCDLTTPRPGAAI
jgi:RimJ/RimL family protein N-acetyltransferase